MFHNALHILFISIKKGGKGTRNDGGLPSSEPVTRDWREKRNLAELSEVGWTGGGKKKGKRGKEISLAEQKGGRGEEEGKRDTRPHGTLTARIIGGGGKDQKKEDGSEVACF